MKIFHLSDLHIGKQLRYYSLKENQQAALSQIVDLAKKHRPDVILICGDIYDRSVPSGEAYTIFDGFLQELSEIAPQIPVLIIAGNHDNPQRLSYASSFLEKHQIYVSAEAPARPEERLKKVALQDEHGEVNFYLLPFLKPGYVRHLFDEGVVTDYESAVRAVLAREEIDYGKRNVLLSHQFYTNQGQKPEICDSEQAVINVGGLDNIDASAVESFDYVALGHIHGPQMVKAPHIRYCGTPLKYSVSEEFHKKAVTMVTLGDKQQEIQIQSLPLIPIQEVRRERGLLKEIIGRATEENCHDFISVTLTDEKEPYHPKEQLEEVYGYILELRVDNTRTRSLLEPEEEGEILLQPMEAFRAFYQEMQSQPMSGEEEKIVAEILDHISYGF
ncbi:MAG: exonuclease SbcCD subunit D [Lachnospiraceae bacterium]|nr:exonuclease SbcCD subunit D [Lachnospiraceae bacterium]